MIARLTGMCRGDGLLYFEASVRESHSPSAIEVSATTGKGASLPSKWYVLDDGRGGAAFSIAIICPLLASGSLSVSIADDSGDSTSFSVSMTRAKWESRLTYRLKPELPERVRDIEAGDFDHFIDIRYWSLIPDVEENIIRGDIVTRFFDDTQLRFTVLDGEGHEIAENVTIISDLKEQSDIDPSLAFRKQYFSLRVPKSTTGFTLHAFDCAHPENRGFRSAAHEKLAEISAEGEKLWRNASMDPDYDRLFRSRRADTGKLARQAATTFQHGCLFSIVVPLYKTPPGLFQAMLRSVQQQSYRNWELVLVDSSPEYGELLQAVKAAAADKRVRYTTLSENLGITENTNIGIAACNGDFVCFLDHDDALEPDALFEYACAIEKQPDIDLLYCDEDKVSEDGRNFFAPFFKPDFDIDWLRSQNYVCHFLCVRRTVLEQLAPPTAVYDGAQDHHLTLRVAEKARSICHVPKVLYHWRVTSESTASQSAGEREVKSYANEAGRRAIAEHLERVGLDARVEKGPVPFSHHVKYLIRGYPLVSIIIPNKDCAAMLKRCVSSIIEKTTYSHFEIVIVENNSTDPQTQECYEELERLDSRIRLVTWPGEFNFSKIVNFGARNSQGEYLLLLNNDTEVIAPEWLENMLGLCQRDDVGAVGARLLYPNGTIQHAGVVITDSWTIGHHAFPELPDSNTGYFSCGVLTHQNSAVTAACMMTSRRDFDAVEGFSEELAVAFNDVEYCFKLRGRGLHIVYEPTAKLYHYESVSRGYDSLDEEKRIRSLRESAFVQGRWPDIYIKGDPYFNPNLKTGSYRLKWEG